MKKWSITKEDVVRANQYAEIICSETNVKQYVIDLGTDDEGRNTVVSYAHDTAHDMPGLLLDVYKDKEPQEMYDFAAWVFMKYLELKDAVPRL